MTRQRKAVISTLGCKVNQLESASFASSLADAEIEIVDEENLADIVILNTCAVTEKAGTQSRQKLRKLLRKNPDAKIYLTGCHAEEAGEQLLSIPELQDRDVSLFGNSQKEMLAQAVISGKCCFQPGEVMKAEKISHLPVHHFQKRTRAYIRIQDGCQAFCSYCIVPYTRGPSRSLPVEHVIAQAKILAEAGHKEQVLTGIHLGFYGVDLTPKSSLSQLLRVLTDTLPEMYWRIGSLESMEIDEALIQLMAERQTIRPHLHIPLQSGSDTILTKMNRRYTTTQFAETVAACHEAIDNLSVGIDILAGFPGESEEEFEHSLSFIEKLNVSYLHAFPYSKRPKTPAAEFPDHISQTEKKQRTQKLLKLSRLKKEIFHTKHLNSIRPVLFEGKRDKNGLLKGVSDNYIDVRIKGPDSLLRTEIPVHLSRLEQEYVLGNSCGGFNVTKS